MLTIDQNGFRQLWQTDGDQFLEEHSQIFHMEAEMDPGQDQRNRRQKGIGHLPLHVVEGENGFGNACTGDNDNTLSYQTHRMMSMCSSKFKKRVL